MGKRSFAFFIEVNELKVTIKRTRFYFNENGDSDQKADSSISETFESEESFTAEHVEAWIMGVFN